MDDPIKAKLWPDRGVRWLVWGFFAFGWTVALLVPPSVISWVFSLFFPPPPGPVDHSKYLELKFLISKSVHISMYAFWMVLSGWLHLAGRTRWRLLVFISLHAMATEFLQQFVGRSGSWSDVGLDHIGSVIGLILSWQWWFRASDRAGEKSYATAG